MPNPVVELDIEMVPPWLPAPEIPELPPFAPLPGLLVTLVLLCRYLLHSRSVRRRFHLL